MASVNSRIRRVLKPLLFKILGKTGYKYAQWYGKMRDIKYRLVEEKEMQLLPHLISPGDAVIDIGANYAYYTDRLSGLVGEKGKVYAFEPIPFTHKICSMIVRSRKLKNVKLFNKGVSDKNESLTFKVPRLAFGGISAGQAHIAGRNHETSEKKNYYNFADEEEVVCQVVALDSFLKDETISPLRFVKIDIEGAEYYALQGMEKIILSEMPVILIEVQPYFLKGFGISEAEFKSYIKNTLGYNIYHYNAETQKLDLHEGDFFDANFILLPVGKLSSFKNIIAE
jgi:FkbM family methyltransferase